MKKNKTRIIALVVAIAMVLGFAVPVFVMLSNTVSAANLEEERRLAEEAEKKKKEAASERAELEAENEKLNAEIEALATDISGMNSDIYQKEQQIKENEERIKELDEEIEKSDDMLKQRLRVMYEQGTTTYIDILFSSKGVSDMLTRYEMVTQLYDHDKKLISQLSANREESKAKKQEIEADKAAIVEARDALVSKQAEFDSKVAKNDSLVSELKEDEAYYAKLQKEHEAAAQSILDEINRQKAAAAAAAANANKGSSSGNSGKVVSSGNGTLGLPCYAGAPVTSEFGSRILRGQQNYHTGIDFGVSTGTPVLAAEDGVVLSSGWRGSYGYCVTIDHGNLVTLYAHNSALNVSAGQKVVRGQQIAAAGSTGNSTGPHIHFSVIVNGQYVNPRPYLW